MRTTEEIKKQMTDAVLANSTLRDAFGLTQGQEWDTQVSSVNILNLIIYIVAMAIRTLEWLHDQFRAEVEERIAAAFPGTISWYWNKVMQFRYGYAVNEYGVYDDAALADDTTLIITHCAVMEVDNGILVKVNKGADTYEILEPEELEALRAYVNTIKFAGTTAQVESYLPDRVSVRLKIWRNPQVLGPDMRTLVGQRDVIREALKKYLDGIAYGGVLNKTKLIDAIQQVEGVVDVTIASGSYIHCYADGTYPSFDYFQSFRSKGGHFEIGSQYELIDKTNTDQP